MFESIKNEGLSLSSKKTFRNILRKCVKICKIGGSWAPALSSRFIRLKILSVLLGDIAKHNLDTFILKTVNN